MRKKLLTVIVLSIFTCIFGQEDSIQVQQDSIQVDDFSSEEFDSIDDEFGIELEETVVVGYGVQKRGDLTSSVSSVKAADITKQPATTAMQSLQGQLSGVNIVNTDQPGATPSVVIRGLGTALGGRDPLYIVDGLIVPNIANINPNDIETIDVMKDAASASIYGVRGANGVVFVTTKRGKKGKPKIGYDAYIGLRTVLNQVEMANSSQFVEYFNEELAGNGGTNFMATNQKYNTDWYDELLKTGLMQNNNLTISGGGDYVNYFFGANHFSEKGLLPGQQFNRTTLRNNNDYKLFDDRLTIKQNISATFSNEVTKPLSAFNAAYRQAPVVPVYYDNGRWGGSFWNTTTGEATYIAGEGENIGSFNNVGNPVSQVYYNNVKNNATTLQGNIEISYEIIDGLSITSRAGATKYWYNNETFVPTRELWLAADPSRELETFENNHNDPANATNVTWANNSFAIEKIETFRWQWENFITYNKNFGRHSINLVAGMSSEEIGVGNRLYGLAYNVPDQRNYWSLDHATGEYAKTVNHINYTPRTLISYFGRLQYDFDDRYYITAVIRRDASSTFKENANYWDNFPSVSGAWTVSNEEFLKDNNTLSFLKFRGGWGRLGNQEVPLNVSQTLTHPSDGNANYVFGPGQNLIFGAYYGSPARNVGWEIVEEYGFGVDFELFRKLSGTFDYYNKTTENAILNITPVGSSPYNNNFYDHAAEVVNKGWEASLTWKDRSSSGDFTYSFGVNFNMNDNEIVSVLPAYDGMTGGSMNNGKIAKRLVAGQSIGAFWLYEADGVWQTQEEIESNPHLAGAKPGHLRYKDNNGDGVIDDRDKKYFDSYLPTYNYGVNITLGYKNFDFNVTGYGAGGNKIYNGLLNQRWGGENITVETYNDRWTGPGSTNVHPGANRDFETSSYYLEDGDYFRINNITLGYNFGGLWTGVRNLRLYVTAQNPVIFTKYSGFSPEIVGRDSDGTVGNPYGWAGMELEAYPTTRTFLMGVNVEF